MTGFAADMRIFLTRIPILSAVNIDSSHFQRSVNIAEAFLKLLTIYTNLDEKDAASSA